MKSTMICPDRLGTKVRTTQPNRGWRFAHTQTACSNNLHNHTDCGNCAWDPEDHTRRSSAWNSEYSRKHAAPCQAFLIGPLLAYNTIT